MISSKLLSFCLLLICPFALARVHLNTTVQLDRGLQHYERTIEIQVDVNTPVTIDDDTMHLEIRMITEQEQETFIEYGIFFKNAQGYYEQLASPALNVAYGKPATIAFNTTIGQTAETSEPKESLTITVLANKVTNYKH